MSINFTVKFRVPKCVQAFEFTVLATEILPLKLTECLLILTLGLYVPTIMK